MAHPNNAYKTRFLITEQFPTTHSMCRLSHDGTRIVHTGKDQFSCHIVKPSLANVSKATITFRVLVDHHGRFSKGSRGLYFGVTDGDHDTLAGKAACGAVGSFMYRCRDGFKHVNGIWTKHALHTTNSNVGGYYAYTNRACKTIILEYTRSPASQHHAGVAPAQGKNPPLYRHHYTDCDDKLLSFDAYIK